MIDQTNFVGCLTEKHYFGVFINKFQKTKKILFRLSRHYSYCICIVQLLISDLVVK